MNNISESFRFAHLADCHIGGWKEEELKELSIRSFREATEKIIDSKVNFLIIAGDLFNTSIPSIDAIKEVGQAVTFTTLILGLGFFMLTFSDYLGLAKIGGFGSLAIFVALLCDLLFFPALIMIFKPKFGQKDVEDNLNFIEVAK